MSILDIFNNDAFRVTNLTDAIIDKPRVPTLLGSLGIFREKGMFGTTAVIERKGAQINLVPTAERGGVRQPGQAGKRIMIPLRAVHLPQVRTVMADEVLAVRRFGTEADLESVQTLVGERQQSMKDDIDLTLEHMRVGALKGLVLDADGSTLYDVYDIMGQSQEVIPFNIATANSGANLLLKTETLKRTIRDAMGGYAVGKIRVICSVDWFDKFVNHDDMKARWDKWQDGAFGRDYPNETNFEFNGVVFTVYSGGTSAGDFIPAGEAYAYPENIDVFHMWFAPGDYMSVVGSLGVPYYSSLKRLDHDKGVEIESQSNPLPWVKYPEAVVKLTDDAS